MSITPFLSYQYSNYDIIKNILMFIVLSLKINFRFMDRNNKQPQLFNPHYFSAKQIRQTHIRCRFTVFLLNVKPLLLLSHPVRMLLYVAQIYNHTLTIFSSFTVSCNMAWFPTAITELICMNKRTCCFNSLKISKSQDYTQLQLWHIFTFPPSTTFTTATTSVRAVLDPVAGTAAAKALVAAHFSLLGGKKR